MGLRRDATRGAGSSGGGGTVVVEVAVVVGAVGGVWVGVHECGGQSGYGVDEAVFCVDGDGVGGHDGGGWVDADLASGA